MIKHLPVIFAAFLALAPSQLASADDDSSVGSISGIETSSGSAHAQVKSGAALAPAERDQALKKSDHVVTGTDTSAAVSLSDGSKVVIGPNSDFAVNSVAIDQHKTTSLQLAYGFLHLVVSKIYGTDKSFVLRNANSVMGVRGTEFFAEQAANGGASSCHTIDGAVVMAKQASDLKDQAKSVTLSAGLTSQMKPGAAAPSAPAKFDVGEYLAAVARRAPSLRKLSAKTTSKPTTRSASKSHRR